jgi:hypothetical protein
VRGGWPRRARWLLRPHARARAHRYLPNQMFPNELPPAAPLPRPAAPAPPIRLILFGDSWVRDDSLVTWPELLGHHLGWPTVNVALPGSHSGTLTMQADILAAHLQRTHRSLHPDAWALVHAGGNDVLHASPTDLLQLIGKAVCCCCCLPCAQIPVIDGPADNVRTLGVRLRERFGVRNMLLVGPPITTCMPLVSRYLMLLIGRGAVSTFLGGVAVRRLNALYITRMSAAAAEAGIRVVAVDEAREIEAIAAGKASSAAATELHTDGSESSEGNSADGGEGHRAALRRPATPDELWADMMHPSQRCHAVLATSMHTYFCRAAPDVPEEASDAEGEPERGRTPNERMELLRSAGGSPEDIELEERQPALP